MKTIRLGTRDSQLALWQAEWVKEHLSALYPELVFALVPFKTKGDKVLNVPLAKIGDKGLFTQELEYDLLHSKIDMAVHSLKDLPTILPDGLEIGAYCEREEPRDVFLSKDGTALNDLPAGAAIGTSSLRRRAQLLHFRPDLLCDDMRGNLQTRWNKLEKSSLRGIILAAAGVKRLGWDKRITQILSEDIMLPAVGQGSIAVEVATARTDIKELLANLNHKKTEKAVRAERALMRKLEGGCQIPIGAYCQIRADGSLELQGMVAGLDGRQLLKACAEGSDPEALGLQVAESLLEQGAKAILDEVRASL